MYNLFTEDIQEDYIPWIIRFKFDKEIIAIKRTNLSEDEKVGLALADNRTSDLSVWDAAMLHHLSMEHDLEPWFKPEDLTELMDHREETAPEDFKEIDENIEIEHRCPACGYEWSGKQS